MGIGPRASLSMDYKPLPLHCSIHLPNSILMSLSFCHVLRNGLNVDELFFLKKETGYTSIKAATDDDTVTELSKDNQLGWLWRNHYIKGANL
jgi:hypothetical protein